MTFLELKPLTVELLPAVVELDRLCFNGQWTLEGYRRELASPNSEFRLLSVAEEEGDKQAGFCREQRAGDKEEHQSHLAPHSSLLTPHSSPLTYQGEEESSEDWLPACPPAPELVGLGCFWSILEEAHITLLAVHPAYQGRGLGQLLLYSLLRLAHQKGLERSTLEVRASNLAALSLYEKFGFKEAGRRKRYYQDTDEDALILWRGDLQQPEFGKTLEEWQSSIGDRLASVGWNLKKSDV